MKSEGLCMYIIIYYYKRAYILINLLLPSKERNFYSS